MSHIIACPRGITLPYSSLFNVTLRSSSKRLTKSRPSEFFWKKAVQPSDSNGQIVSVRDTSFDWLDYDAPALSDTEDESPPPAPKDHEKPKKAKSFSRLRRIAFKAFTSKADGTGHKSNVVTTTEVIRRQVKVNEFDGYESKPEDGVKRRTIFQSWKFKSNGKQVQVKKMVAVLKSRINASSPLDKLPKTWDEYHRFYANEQIDVLNPPLPPMKPASDGAPSAFQSRFYMAPRPANERIRQLVVNRLDVLGGKPFDPSEEGKARTKQRGEMADKLLLEGTAPESLDSSWVRSDSVASDATGMNLEQTQAMLDGVRSGDLPPETLEQHPVFKKIVNQCRELFGTSLSMLSILDDDRQIFLAESGLGGMQDIPRDIGFCAHTILSGRKGFTILDTHKDWRFENGPLTQTYGSRFYAGVPLMAPNLDGSEEAEAQACPIGTLCVVDSKPREVFSVEDRKKLVYMAEYARREIEKWFSKKMEQKIKHLTASQETWNQELTRVVSSESEAGDSMESEVLSDSSAVQQVSSNKGLKKMSSGSISTAPTSPASQAHLPLKSPTGQTGPGLFDDLAATVKPKMRKVFDLATKLVAETLDLSLVYLAAVRPHGDSNDLGQTIIISGYNIPLPVPVFDPGLHLRALRTLEGGLMYQNPNFEESREEGFHLNSSGPASSDGGDHPFASAMLLAVGSEAEPNSGGFVLAGYTSNPKRVLGAEDVTFMKQFAGELARYTSRIKL